MIKRTLVIFFTLLSLITAAQEPAMADTFRQEGKIYIVISVIAIIFVCLAGFLIYLERKIKKLEEKINSEADHTKADQGAL
jgi:hypothetical protein